MSDSFTETTTQSWFSRITESIKGILFGFVLIVGAIVLLFWNEGRSVTTYKTLKEGAGAVVLVKSDKVDSANEGKLVHMTGDASTSETLSDPEFAVSLNALKLQRTVEMYQWKENKEESKEKNTGGSETTTTTYKYNKVWSENPIDSSSFKKTEGHINPGSMKYRSNSWSANNVSLGAYKMSSGLIRQISNFNDLPSNDGAFQELAMDGAAKTSYGYYLGETEGTPKIGDMKVSFEVVRPGTYSIVSKQLGETFEPYIASAGGSVELLSSGTQSAENMFAAAQSANTMLTWGLRAFGLLLVFFGLTLILRPLSVLADVLPILGDIVEMGTGLVAFLVALLISVVTIAVAWFFYRPLVSIVLLALGGGAVWYFMKKRKEVREKRALTTPDSAISEQPAPANP